MQHPLLSIAPTLFHRRYLAPHAPSFDTGKDGRGRSGSQPYRPSPLAPVKLPLGSLGTAAPFGSGSSIGLPRVEQIVRW